MCSHYEAPSAMRISEDLGLSVQEPVQPDLWPGRRGPFLRKQEEGEGIEAIGGVFGLLPHWSKDEKLARRTYNARSETASAKPSFRAAWSQGRHCIIPAVAIYEPDWRSGKAVPTRITRTDDDLLLIAGLWERWHHPTGNIVHSFSMLTVNADEHPLMRNYHRPTDEKRMVVILERNQIDAWLTASPKDSMSFMREYPSELLSASARS